MANVNKVKIDGTWYDIEDATARSTASSAASTASTASSNASSALAAANAALPKTGGWLSGLVGSTSYIKLVDEGVTYGTAPGSDVWGHPYNMCDQDSNATGQVRVIYRANGENQTQINSMQKVNGSTVENHLRLGVNTNGQLTVSVSDAVAWRNALGASSGVWPTSAGGTGGADSGLKSHTNAAFSGTIYYRSYGFYKIIYADRINLTTALENTSVSLGTLAEAALRPSREIYVPAGSRDGIGMIRVEASGNISYYKPRDVNSWATSYNISFCFVMP